MHLRAIVSKCALGLAASGIELTLRLCRGSGKRHLLGLVRRGDPGLQLGNLSVARGQVVLSSIACRRLGKPGFIIFALQLRT